MNPRFASSGSIDPIRLTTVVRMSNDAEMPINPRVIALNLIVPAPNLLDSTARAETTVTSTVKIPIITPRILTESHNLSLSKNVKRITAPTSNEIANTKFLIALSRTLKARPFIYFPKPPNASPRPERTSLIPSIGLASFSIAFAIFTIANTILPLRAIESIVPQLIPLTNSTTFSKMPLITSQTFDAPF